MHKRFLLLLALFTVGVVAQVFVFPPMEGSDEPLHFGYMAHLLEAKRLPDRTTYLENCTRQQSGQPPLTYAIAAIVLSAFPVPDCDDTFAYYFEQTNNPWLLTPRPMRRDDNNTNFLPIADVPPPQGLPVTLYAARLTTSAFGVLAVVGAYLAAGEIFRRRQWQLTATAIFAFTPTFFHLSAYFSNDPGATALTTLAIWRTLHLVNHGVTVRRLLVIGLLIGVGALIKVSVMLVSVAVGGGVALAILRREQPPGALAFLRQLIVGGLLTLLPIALTFGVWAGWGALQYDDPIGTNTHVHDVLNYDPPLGFIATLRGLPDVYLTYVGLLGYANVYMHPVTYITLTSVLLLAVAGYGVGARRQNWHQPVFSYVVVLMLVWLTVFIGFLQWYRTIFDVTGRLLLPAHIAYAIMLTGGLKRLAERVPALQSSIAVLSAGTFMLAGTVSTFVSLHAAYAPPPAHDVVVVQGNTFVFDNTVRLLGFAHEGDTFGQSLDHITLCWQVLQPTDRVAAYAVRYVRDGVPVANRTTVHGLGRFNSTLWQAGDTFCDAVDVPVADPRFGASAPQPGTSYDVLVFLLDARTQDANWTAFTSDGTPVQFPVVGQLTYVSAQ
jgi:4-amino-4-deoxy-L-arabinose transferase-like glycosyltransferase